MFVVGVKDICGVIVFVDGIIFGGVGLCVTVDRVVLEVLFVTIVGGDTVVREIFAMIGTSVVDVGETLMVGAIVVGVGASVLVVGATFVVLI